MNVAGLERNVAEVEWNAAEIRRNPGLSRCAVRWDVCDTRSRNGIEPSDRCGVVVEAGVVVFQLCVVAWNLRAFVVEVRAVGSALTWLHAFDLARGVRPLRPPHGRRLPARQPAAGGIHGRDLDGNVHCPRSVDHRVSSACVGDGGTFVIAAAAHRRADAYAGPERRYRPRSFNAAALGPLPEER